MKFVPKQNDCDPVEYTTRRVVKNGRFVTVHSWKPRFNQLVRQQRDTLDEDDIDHK